MARLKSSEILVRAILLSAIAHACLVLIPMIQKKVAPPQDKLSPLVIKLRASSPRPVFRDEQKPLASPVEDKTDQTKKAKPVLPTVNLPDQADVLIAKHETKPSSPPEKSDHVESAEKLLQDPSSGEIFYPYFEEIKRRIQKTAEWHRPYVLKEKGSVDIEFVIDRDGGIRSLSANPDDTSRGNPMLLSRAMQIIRDAEPFKPFPAELDAKFISFKITLVFGQNA